MKQLIGTQIGQYQIEALLGEGGMGAVYRAHDLKHDRMVALKIMLANLANKPQFRSRFMQEAESIAHFSSPAIVAVYDTGTYEESPYIVMEYIEGGSLINYMRQLDWSGAKPTVETIITIAAQVAEGLSYAHQRGLIHRDIKPGNVLLKMRDGAYVPRQAIITDFGLAIQQKDGDEMDTAPFMGSLAYMSPEQCENKTIDGRSDIYALGILLYQLTTGQLPFKIDAPADIVKHLNESPLPPSLLNTDMPELLETITLKAMEKKPGDRYQSAAEMAHALRQALANPDLKTAVIAQESSSAVTQWLDNKWVAAIDVEDRVDIHQTWTSLGKNRLFIVHQYEESRIVGLEKDIVTVGRETNNDIMLDDLSVSGKHIRLTRTPQGWNVSDVGSTNHSYLGERLLEYEQVYDWPSDEPLRVGPYFLRWQPFEAEHRQSAAVPILAAAALSGASVAGAAMLTADPKSTASAAPVLAAGTDLVPDYSNGEILGIAITPPSLELDPDSQSLLEVSITNRDVTVKDVTLRFEAEGHPLPWISLSDYQMKLLPDETQNTTALVDLSQAPTILADTHLVKLIATTDKGEVEITEVSVIVKSLEDFTLDMHPSNLQEKVTCRLTISDHSNFQNEYTIMGIDDSDALMFEFDEPQNAILTNFDDQQQQIKVSPRQEAWLGFRIRPRKRPLFGSNKVLPFKVRVRTLETEWQSLNGQVEISPRITRRALLLLLLLLLLIGGTGYLAFYQYNTAQAERYAELQGQLEDAEARAANAKAEIAAIDAQLEAGNLSEEERAALEAEKAAKQAELDAATADAAVIGDEAATVAEGANIDPAEAEAAAAAAEAEAAAAAEAEAAAQAALEASFTPTPEPNNPPTDIKFSASTITENTSIGTVIGTFTAADPDSASAGSNIVVMNKSHLSRIARQGEEFTYTLVSGSGDTHNDYFAIQGDQLVTAADIDFEEVSSLSFRVKVTDAAGDSFEKSFTIPVIDTDDIPQLSVSNVTVVEGESSAKVVVSVNGSNFDTATVNYETSDGTAVAGTDFTTTSGTLTWDKGDTDSQTITIPLLDNEIDQPDRTFFITLSDATKAIIATGTATITITDDDAEPTLVVSDLTINESVTGGKATITVALTGASSEEVTVDYATADSTAKAGNDYVATNGTLTWAAEATGSKTFDVTIKTDDIDEPNETFSVILSGVENASISDGDATITISDNNDSPKIIIGDVTLTEGDTLISVPVTMTGKTSEDAWVDYSTSNGNGTNAATAEFPDPDFDTKTDRLIWAAGTDGVQNISIQVNDDDIDEVDQEFFVISLFDNSTSVVVQDTTGTIYINDNDAKPTISLQNLSGSPVNEGATSINAAVTIEGRSSRPITVFYSTQSGTATGDKDYTTVTNGKITWPALDTTEKSINIFILEDEIDESDTETFKLSLNTPENAQLHATNNSTNIVIQDNDPLPVISASVAGGGVDEDVVGGKATISVAIDRPSTQIITTTYTTVNGTAVAGSDYTAKTQTLTWNPGESAPITVTVNIINDEIFENDETFIFRLQSKSSSATIGTADTIVEIRNDDPAPVISIVNSDPVTVTEGISTTNLSVALDRVTNVPVTVNWTTQDAGAVVGSDYAFSTGTLTWNATSTLTQTIPLTITEDSVDELSESFTVLLQDETVGTLNPNSSTTTVTITDNDDAPVLNIGSITVTEGNNSDNPAFSIPVTMTRSSYLPVTVEYTITGGTAVSGTDYIDNGTGILTWSAETSGVQNIPLQIQSDSLDEDDLESIFVQLQNVSNSAIVSTSTATSYIEDDDLPPEIDLTGITYSEDVVTATITATISGQSGDSISVQYDTSDNTATAGADYTDTTGTLTWAAGDETPQTFTVTITDDDLDEQPSEMVNLTLSAISGGTATFASGNTTETATLYITDDDYTPVITTNQSRSVSEDATANVNIGLPISVLDADSSAFSNWTVTSVSPISGLTYFAIDSTTGQISLTPAGETGLDYETETTYTLTLTVSDGMNTSTAETVTINVQDVDDTPPVVSPNTGLALNEGATAPLTISLLDATDVDSTNNALLFSIGSGPSEGYLDNGIITGTTSITFTRQMLANGDVSYTHGGGDNIADSFTFTVTDPNGNAAAAETFAITINPVNDLPVLDLDADNSSGTTNGGFDTTFTEDGGAVAIVDTDLTLTDSDTPTMASATITIANIADGASEVLTATVSATGIVATYNSGVLTLTGPSTIANFQQVLRTVTYNNSSQAPSTTARNIQFVVNDGNSNNSNSAIVTSVVTVVAQNDIPVLDLNGSGSPGNDYTASFVEDAANPVAIVSPNLTLTDVDNEPIQSVTITLTNHPDGISETLSVTLSGGITVGSGYNSSTGVLTLTGPASVNQFQTVLRTVSYNNTSQAPNTTSRVITFVVSDGTANSAAVNSTVSVTAVNDAPILNDSFDLTLTNVISNTASPAGDLVSAILASDGGSNPITDPDAGAVEGIAIIAVEDGCNGGGNSCDGVWQYSTSLAPSTWISIPHDIAATNALLLADDYRIRFVPDSSQFDPNPTPPYTITFRAWDRTSGTSGTSTNITATGNTTAFSTTTETATITVTMN